MNVEINPKQIHVWQIEYIRFSRFSTELLDLLSEFEKSRVSRYRVNDKVIAYVITHGLLRILTGKYLKANPSTLEIMQGDHVKSRLRNSIRLDFSMSYTNNWSVIGFAFGGTQIGVDIERVQASVSILSIIQNQFSFEEQQSFAQLTESERLMAFYRVWTRKEAYLKGLGKGLSVPMHSFSVSITTQPEFTSLIQWRLQEFFITDQIVGTVAANTGFELKCYTAGYELLNDLL